MYSRLGLYTGRAFVVPEASFAATEYGHVIIFPCGEDENDRNGFDHFHNVTYYSSMSGPGMIMPITTMLNIDGLPIWLFSYRVMVPGTYTLKVSKKRHIK